MTVYIVVYKSTREFCNVYATRELAEKAIEKYPGTFLIWAEEVIQGSHKAIMPIRKG